MAYYNIEETEEKSYACWLASLVGIGRKTLHNIVRTAGSYREAYALSDRQLAALLNEKEIAKWQQHKAKLTPQGALAALEEKRIHFTYYGAGDYPRKLCEIPDKPLGLYYLGGLPKEQARSVAMIGARRYSDYGRCMAEYFADRLAAAGITIISGMAMGIDGISQRAALKAGGESYGILGCGVDIVYPESNRRLYEELIEKGGVISEYAPGTAPRAMMFPQRNRIISALSDVVLVVEAREKSGTLITVDMALEQGREVYAVPGRCTDSLSMGCNKLLRQGAGVAVTPDELLEDIGWGKAGVKEKQQTELSYEMSPAAGQLYGLLDVVPCTQDELIARLRRQNIDSSVPDVCRGLLELEMKGIAVRVGGQYRLANPKI